MNSGRTRTQVARDVTRLLRALPAAGFDAHDVRRLLGWPTLRTAYRYLEVLQDQGLVERVQVARYRPRFRLVRMQQERA